MCTPKESHDILHPPWISPMDQSSGSKWNKSNLGSEPSPLITRLCSWAIPASQLHGDGILAINCQENHKNDPKKYAGKYVGKSW